MMSRWVQIRLASVTMLLPMQASLAAEAVKPTDLPANQWVAMNEPPMGVQVLGWDEIRYASDLDGILLYGAYRSFTSENQNAIWLYRFRENRWRLLHLNLFFVRDELTSDGGHTAGRMVYDQARKVLVYQGLTSMSRNDRFRTWLFDPRALVGWDANPLSPTPNIEYDAASVWLEDRKLSLEYRADRGTWVYDAAANRWKQLAPAGQGPAFTAEAVYDRKRQRVLAFGGSTGAHYGGKSWTTLHDLWAFDLTRRNWQKLATHNPPPARSWPQIAASPAADVLLLTAGLTGERSAQGAVKSHRDTWALDLETLEWHDLNTPSPPGISYSNHLAYDAANDVFLLAAYPARNLHYGYACGMWAFKYQSQRPAKAQTPAPASTPPEPVSADYNLAALPKPEGQWMSLGSGPVSAVGGWAFRPALATDGKRLLLAFGEYDPPGRYQDEGCMVYAFEYRPGDRQWSRLGRRAVSESGVHAQAPAAAYDSAGRPVVAYQALRPWNPTQVTVKHFDGQWTIDPTGSPGPAKDVLAALPALCGGPGPLAVAWQHHPNMGKGQGVYVAETAASDAHGPAQWKLLSGGLNTKDGAVNAEPVADSRAQFVCLVRDTKGRLVAAWQEQKAGFNGENATPERIHVRRYEAGQWTELAKSGDHGLPVTTPYARQLSYALVLYQDQPAVAVTEGTDGGRAKLRVLTWSDKAPQWSCLNDGTASQPIGSQNLLGPESGALRPALACNGRELFVAWPEFLPGQPPLLFVKKWDGTSWHLIGGPLNWAVGKGLVQHPAMVMLNGKPVVAWTEADPFKPEAGPFRQIFAKMLE